MRRKRDVVEGQVYRKLGPGGGVWQVVAIRKDGLGMPHAQMRRADDPWTLKTLSLAVLLDPHEFERMPDADA